MNMVERVARAVQALKVTDYESSYEIARAAIAAIEPTLQMLTEGFVVTGKARALGEVADADEVWAVMREAALAEADLPTDATGVE